VRAAASLSTGNAFRCDDMHDGGSASPLKSRLRRALGIGAGWGSLWLAFWLGAAIVIGMLSPDSIDPGEPTGLIVIFGLMGLLSGLAFAGLAFVWRRPASRPSCPCLARLVSGCSPPRSCKLDI
jgi:hypothetical protein